MSITLTILWEGESHLIKTYPNEYRNLMMLIYDRMSPEAFGDCLGMGKCGTCLIEIIEGPDQLTSYDRNEKTTLNKIGVTHKNTRLSCQILIDQHLDGLKLIIL